jgi:hypothetical protein
MRWQVELAFKRLKSLGGFAELQARDPKLARSWLLAHLIAAVLIETSLSEDLDFPPEGRPGEAIRQPSLWRAWQRGHRRLQAAWFMPPRRRARLTLRRSARRRLAEPPRKPTCQANSLSNLTRRGIRR